MKMTAVAIVSEVVLHGKSSISVIIAAGRSISPAVKRLQPGSITPVNQRAKPVMAATGRETMIGCTALLGSRRKGGTTK